MPIRLSILRLTTKASDWSFSSDVRLETSATQPAALQGRISHTEPVTERRAAAYFWNGGRVGDGRHDLIDEVHGDVTHHPGSLVLLVGEGLRGFALLPSYDTHRNKVS